jgi:hypothetical protein
LQFTSAASKRTPASPLHSIFLLFIDSRKGARTASAGAILATRLPTGKNLNSGDRLSSACLSGASGAWQ